MNNKPYESLRYFALALDPIHVGTGGMRLGRVDMSIVREPGTNLPKIPGTSLAGAARTYAAMQEDGKFPQCAGQGGHCGRPDCPVCVTFGFAGTQNGSFQGLAKFSDARLLFFPVHSLAGPVWVTCPEALKAVGVGVTAAEPADEQVRVAQGVKQGGRLNLGWLMLEVAGSAFSLDGQLSAIPDDIKKRAVLVSNKMFSHIVNDNLEVRTSVSIDPQTGAAAEGALFTYEALPRASVLVLEVVVSDPKFYKIGNQTPLQNNGGKQKVIQTVEKGLALFASLGIGGMNTRGMGRLCVPNLNAGGAQ
jgi:CRISPR-associated protein Cmr4